MKHSHIQSNYLNRNKKTVSIAQAANFISLTLYNTCWFKIHWTYLSLKNFSCIMWENQWFHTHYSIFYDEVLWKTYNYEENKFMKWNEWIATEDKEQKTNEHKSHPIRGLHTTMIFAHST